MRSFLLAVCLVAGSSQLAMAMELTRDKVERFIMETNEISQPNSVRGDTEVRAYLEKHLNEQGAFKSVVTYNIPGYPAQPKKMVLDKDMFIENVLGGRGQLQEYKSSIKIQSSEIGRDGQSAVVKTIGTETGKMPVEGEAMPFQGTSVCTQYLGVSEDEDIFLVSADCATSLEFLPF